MESLRAVFEVVFPPLSLIHGTRLQQRLQLHTHVLANAPKYGFRKAPNMPSPKQV
ncbi:hypothetical protein OB236_22955 [Paenibacillus sp. WQ 127069]|uniref:Uncharacterized protein n=1 Tax=Paenibacillus baimaensis TaxID=2982185 RepID=A0ABT2UJZ9_9BACL|nr:hypothetical protein [Paenibacillus sp. WQ 127069]